MLTMYPQYTSEDEYRKWNMMFLAIVVERSIAVAYGTEAFIHNWNF